MKQINLFEDKTPETKQKSKKLHNEVVFKEYNMDQLMLPTSLSDVIPEKHLVRVINTAIERMNIEPLLKRYQGGGTSSYNPKMMLKILVYAYTDRNYSSRRVAKSVAENVHYMWLSGGNRPDFRTINNFRSVILKGIIEEVFASVLEMLEESGYIKLENYFLDGTKIEANANKYSFVWKKSVEKNKEKLRSKVKKLLENIEELNKEEDEKFGNDPVDGNLNGPIDSKKLEQKIKELNERLAGKKENKDIKKAVEILEEDCLKRLEKYEEYETKFDGRNSFSKTDSDATFMRMKEDHMKNGQLKPGYNIQIGTEGQFVVGFSVHQNRSDTGCLITHLEKTKEMLGGKLPGNIVADSGYGSEENYKFLENNELENYVKYNTFHKEQKKAFRKEMFNVENFIYDELADKYICPAGNELVYNETRKYKTDNGYETTRKYYKCYDCESCQYREECTKSKYGRTVQVNHELKRLKAKATENLNSDKGRELRSMRGTEVESVFGRLKNNWGFRRFLLRGLEKIKIEWGLLCIANNMAKMMTKMATA